MEILSQYRVNSTSDLVAVEGLTERVDLYRVDACHNLDSEQRSEMGQFFTPPSVARFMASLFGDSLREIRLLDAGAGVGTLTAAFVEEVCRRGARPRSISVVAYELESLLAEYLHLTLTECQEACEECGIEFLGKVLEEDFISAGVDMLRGGLFPVERYSFNRAILNPPYRKIQSESRYRHLLSSIGIETSNLYAAFLAITIDLLEPGGELVAITPRSFCNGPYFKSFRHLLLRAMALRRIHVFESREEAFKADDVLQENIIFHAVKGGDKGQVLISASYGPANEGMTVHEVDYEQVIRPDDPDLIVHIATSAMDQCVLDRIGVFRHSLDDLGIDVSTGRVVDFRVKDFLRTDPGENTVPLIYPTHFSDGFIRWPRPGSKKPNGIVPVSQTKSLLLPSGNYVLVKRFSAKEERRRVLAAIFDPKQIPAPFVGFENHLNVYHRDNAGLPMELAKGLALFLNSTLIDSYFRQFNGHTQVNATDLRMLQYPSQEVLKALGAHVGDEFPSQTEIDALLEREIRRMADIQSPNPVAAKQKIDQALEILEALGMPRGQLNERSALTLAHSQLVKAIIDEFAPRFVPGGHVIYVGDTGNKWRYFDGGALQSLGVTVDVHGKMPDVVIHDIERDWLVLIEAVTSHGPVNPKRREELALLFQGARPGLVYVTAFLTRNDMTRYISEISWETEVWVREAGTHLIHFDGKRFLGPYDSRRGHY